MDVPHAPLAPEDERILNRELLRLDMAISAAEKLAQGQKPIVVMLHYPPLLLTVLDTPFTQVLARHRVHTVVYGHLHGAGIRAGFNGEHPLSADLLRRAGLPADGSAADDHNKQFLNICYIPKRRFMPSFFVFGRRNHLFSEKYA